MLVGTVTESASYHQADPRSACDCEKCVLVYKTSAGFRGYLVVVVQTGYLHNYMFGQSQREQVIVKISENPERYQSVSYRQRETWP